MKKGPNPKLFLMMAVGAIVVGGGLNYMAMNGLSDAKSRLQQLQADSKDAKTLQKQLTESQANLQESSVTLQHLEQGVQDYAYVPTLLFELEKVGKASGISVVGVRPVPKTAAPKKEGESTSTKKKAYDELDIEVKGRGTYRSVMNFIEALGKFPKVVAARTIDLSPKNDPLAPAGSLDVTINLRAYVFASPKDTARPSKQGVATAAGGSLQGLQTPGNHGLQSRATEVSHAG